MVHYSGEKGIDDGAIHMEFLTYIMSDIKSAVFPTDAPRDSMLDVDVIKRRKMKFLRNIHFCSSKNF